MQPVYQIPGGLLEAHISRLSDCAAVKSWRGHLYPLLFLSGLRVAFVYYRTALAGDEFFTNWAPTHNLDDGLDRAARGCLSSLIREARSRRTRENLRMAHPDGTANPNWHAVKFAFVSVFHYPNKEVAAWITRGDAEQNKLRLSCAMGAVALWHSTTVSFVHELMHNPVGLDDDVAAVINSFALSRETALPELT